MVLLKICAVLATLFLYGIMDELNKIKKILAEDAETNEELLKLQKRNKGTL